MNNIARRAKLFLDGFLMFKDWDLWLRERLHILPPKGRGLFRFRNGIVFHMDFSRDSVGIFQEIWLKDVYEKHYKVKPGDVVIDIGAHIGSFAVFAATKGAKVYAYEPTPKTFELLRENAKGHAITPRNLAVSDKASEVLMIEVEGGSSGNTFAPDGTKGTFRATTTTLADIFQENNIERCNLLKIDCEGAETGILRATPREFFKRVDNIAMEYHQNLQEVLRILEDRGCTVTETVPMAGNTGLGFLYGKGSI